MTSNENKRNKFQINAIADFKDANDTDSSKSSRYISLFSDEKKQIKSALWYNKLKKLIQ